MILKIVLLSLLVSFSFADEFFLDLSQGISIGTVKLDSVSYITSSSPISNSSEIGTSMFEVKVGYSFYIYKNLLLEPSLGTGYLQNSGQTLSISPMYALEIPIMYKDSNIKYGLLAKYNYYPEITTEAVSDSVRFKNKDSFSLGAKIIFGGGEIIDLFLKYEYIFNAKYKESFVETNSVNNIIIINSELNLNGGHISAGIRFKF
ncbi:MAG: hypothetical protein COA39_001995 [Sulfurimonas sp.]|nr:hypothetical protein [Sulfurimonas sp.]